MKYAAKNLSKLLLAFSISLLTILGSNQASYAAGEGTMMSNAVDISFGQTYLKTWTSFRDHLNHYCKITVPQKGILTVNASKPFDDEGEYGSLYFTIYSEDGSPVWDNRSYYSQEMATDTYSLSVGLNGGTYYMTLKPGFTVTSGVISTNYSFNFNPTEYCEVEPNESLAIATVIESGNEYTGFYGNDGGNYEDCDYWRFYLTSGLTYKIAIGNYAAITNTTTIIDFYTPSGEEESSYGFNKMVDADGLNYIMYTAKQSGYYALRVDNYHHQQFKYSVKVVQQEKQAQIISIPETNITRKTTDAKTFFLNASAATPLSYSSSNTNVASVYSNGEVHVWGAGTTIIHISAKETDYYKPASIQVKLSVIDPTGTEPENPTVTPISPTPTKITVQVPSKFKVQSGKKKATVTWKRVANCSGYEIRYSLKSSMKNAKTIKVAIKNSQKKIITKLKSKKTYWFQIRSFRTFGGKRYYSKWSSKKKIKIK